MAIEEADRHKEGLWLLNDLVDSISDWFIDVNIDSYADDIRSYYQAITDKHDTTKEQIHQIFDNAYSVEAQHVEKARGILARAQELRKAKATLKEILDPSPVDGSSFALSLSVDAFGEKLNEATAGLNLLSLDHLVSYDINGSPRYNWEEIRKVS
jgi:hypothetical protein